MIRRLSKNTGCCTNRKKAFQPNISWGVWILVHPGDSISSLIFHSSFLKSFCLLLHEFCWFQYYIKDGKLFLTGVCWLFIPTVYFKVCSEFVVFAVVLVLLCLSSAGCSQAISVSSIVAPSLLFPPPAPSANPDPSSPVEPKREMKRTRWVSCWSWEDWTRGATNNHKHFSVWSFRLNVSISTGGSNERGVSASLFPLCAAAEQNRQRFALISHDICLIWLQWHIAISGENNQRLLWLLTMPWS